MMQPAPGAVPPPPPAAAMAQQYQYQQQQQPPQQPPPYMMMMPPQAQGQAPPPAMWPPQAVPPPSVGVAMPPHQQGQPAQLQQQAGQTGEIRTLWIGDLQYWMDENYLSSCFAQTGEVDCIVTFLLYPFAIALVHSIFDR